MFTVEFAGGNFRIYNNQEKYKIVADAHFKLIINLKRSYDGSALATTLQDCCIKNLVKK